MYHVANDRRAQESGQKISEALERLLGSCRFDRLCVSQICAEAGVSRPTFYRLFDIPADVIQWRCETSVLGLCTDLEHADPQVLEMPFRFVVRHIFDHPEALELACRAERVDIADAAFRKHISPLLHTVKTKHAITDADLDLSTTLVSAIITSSFRSWLEHGKREPVDVVYERVTRIIRELH